MATSYESQYFFYHNKQPLYLGCDGGSTDHSRNDILHGKLPSFIDDLAQRISEFLSYQPWLSIPEDYGLYIGFRQLPDTLKIIFYLTPQQPKCNFKYLGVLKYNHPNGLKLDGHTWIMSFEECFADYLDEIPRYIKLLLRRSQIWQPNHVLIITVDQQEKNTILSCVWSPIASLSEFYTTTMKQCPEDCYPIELRVRNRGWFFWIKKEAFNSSVITNTDIIKNN